MTGFHATPRGVGEYLVSRAYMQVGHRADSSGHDRRFRALLDAHLSDIERYCLRRLRPAAAEDAAAEVMLVAWRRMGDVPTPEGDARLWLFGVARNVVSDAQRSERRRLRLDARVNGVGTDQAQGPEIQVVRRAEDQELVDAMQSLKVNDREILALRIWDELSRADVASMLGISVAGVDKRLARALQRLRRSLRAQVRRGSLADPKDAG